VSTLAWFYQRLTRLERCEADRDRLARENERLQKLLQMALGWMPGPAFDRYPQLGPLRAEIKKALEREGQ
jgi:hypothetical protein